MNVVLAISTAEIKEEKTREHRKFAFFPRVDEKPCTKRNSLPVILSYHFIFFSSGQSGMIESRLERKCGQPQIQDIIIHMNWYFKDIWRETGEQTNILKFPYIYIYEHI